MRRFFFLLLLISLGCISADREDTTPTLKLYSYDSFVTYGLSESIERFEEQYSCRVEVSTVGNAGSVLNKAILEKADPQADMIVGIDNNLLAKALKEDILAPYFSPNLKLVPDYLIFDRSGKLTPFDYGYIAIIYDSERIKQPPTSLDDLLSPRFNKSLILEDPRTSSPGLAFLIWTVAEKEEGYLNYWKALEPNILTISGSWDTAYGMFTAGEAPMVLSYATSPAYHVEYENTTRYKAASFSNGNYMQIEGMGILKGSRNPEIAKRFIDWMLTEEFQENIPLTNFMYPVNPNAKLPKSFEHAARPDPILLDAQYIDANLPVWLSDWTDLMTT